MDKMLSAMCLALFLSTLPYAAGHSLRYARCPRVDAMEGFEIDKFLGSWYVIGVYSVINSCITLDYAQTSPGRLKISQGRQLAVVDAANVSHTSNYAGEA